MKLYVSGPMTNIPEFNFPTFDAVRDALLDMGHEVVSPADHDRAVLAERGLRVEDMPGYAEGDVVVYSAAVDGMEFEALLSWDLAQIATECDAIVMLPGWGKSTGAAHERYVAEATGKTVYVAEKRPGPRGAYWYWYITPDDVQKRLTAVSKYADRIAAEAIVHGSKSDEVRVVDPNTGGAKGSKLQRFDLLPWDSLKLVAEHFGRGAAKYEERNWERGYAWGLSAAALHRHFTEWWQFGVDYDDEGFHHLTAVAWHALVLLAFATRGIGTDDRPYAGVTPSHNEETAA